MMLNYYTMKLKIIYRSSVVWNIIGYTILAFFFLYAERALSLEKTALDMSFFKSFITSNKILLSSFIISILSLYTLRKFSFTLVLSLLVYVGAVFIYDLFQQFDKLILLMLFFYILFSYYFLLELYTELSRAYLNPKFSENELFDPMLYKINASIVVDSKVVGSGYLTNWDEVSCFLHTSDNLSEFEGTIKVEFDGCEFLQDAKIASKGNNTGIGLKFVRNENDTILNWNEFIKIITDQGFQVEYMK